MCLLIYAYIRYTFLFRLVCLRSPSLSIYIHTGCASSIVMRIGLEHVCGCRQLVGLETRMSFNWQRALVPSIWYQALGTKYLVPRTWYQAHGTKYLGTTYLVPSAWYQLPGTKYSVPSTRYQVPGTKYLVPSTWY